MARKKPVGWRRESARHGLAAKGIKTGRVKGVTMAQIRSGYARNKYGLDTSSGSRYAYLRSSLGWSDEEAQADIFGIGTKLTPDQLTPEEETRKDRIIRDLGLLAQKAQEGRMNIMTGPRIAEAARHVLNGENTRAIGMLNEVAGLGPKEVTRRAKRAIYEIEILQREGGDF